MFYYSIAFIFGSVMEVVMVIMMTSGENEGIIRDLRGAEKLYQNCQWFHSL